MIKLILRPNDISEIVGFNGNIDVNQLKPMIETSQRISLKNVFGDDLLTKLQEPILTGVYVTILENFAIPILAWHSASLYLSLNTIKTANNGSYKLSGNNGDALPTASEIKDMALSYKNVAISYENQFLEFMKTQNIPEFKQENRTTNRIIPWY